jgi:hypothetical protein
LVSCGRNWGDDRVWFQDKLGRLHSLPTSWTAGAVDPFVALAAGRSLFRVADLLELARQMACMFMPICSTSQGTIHPQAARSS